MTKSKKNLKTLLIILGAILLLLLAAVLILPKPLAMSVYNDNFDVRFTTYGPFTYDIEDFDGLMRDKYTFESDKGQVLTGYKYYRSNAETKGLVVMAHGFGGGHRSYMNIADYFTSNGYAVFAYDATGNDESGGEAEGGLPQGVIDLDYALFSEAGKKYVEEYNNAVKAYGESVGEMTEEMINAYCEENFDKNKGYELDNELMAQMLDFYNSSIY